MSDVTFFRGENPLKADKLNLAFSERVYRGGDTMTGVLTLWRDPVLALEAATKQYVDNKIVSIGTGSYLPLTGGILTGPLTVGASPNSSLFIVPGAAIGNSPRIYTNATSPAGIAFGNTNENTLVLRPGAASTNSIVFTRTGTGGIQFSATTTIDNGSGIDLNVGSTISIGTRVAAGATTTISTPNGSHINILPQGSGIVRIGGGLAPLEMGRILQSVTWSPANWSPSATPAFRQGVSLNGTLSNPGLNSLNQWVVNSDDMTVTGQALFHTGIFYNFGGSNYAGNRGGIYLNMTQTGPTSGSSTAGGIEAVHIGVVTNYSFGGTNPGPGARGAVFNSNIYGSIGAGSTNLQGMVGMELNVESRTGSTYQSNTGIAIISTSAHQQVGLARSNYAFAVGGQSNSIGFDQGFQINNWGLRSEATIMEARFAGDLPTFSVKRGFNLAIIDFVEDIFTAGDFTVGPTGRLRVGTGYIDIAANGMNISVDGAVATAGTLVASVALTYATDGNHYWAEDAYGGVWKLIISGSNITGLTMEVPPHIKGTPPANPLTLTPIGYMRIYVPLAPIQVNVTWTTTRNTLTLQSGGGPIVSGAPITLPGDPTAVLHAATKQYVDTAVVGGTVGLGNTGRNLLHNGLFNVAQRGTGPWTGTGSFTADRWAITLAGDTVSVALFATSDAQRTAIGDEAATACIQNVFTGNAAVGSYSYLTQAIEGVRRLAGKQVTISFWAVASAALKIGVNLYQAFGTGGSPSAGAWATATSVTLSTTWARYTVTVAVPSATGKTLGTNGSDCTYLALWYSSGATNNANAGNIGVQSGTVSLWGVQLEVSNVATPLEKRTPQEELAECQRFFQVGSVDYMGYTAAGIGMHHSWAFPTPMRATPTCTSNVTASTNISGANFVANDAAIMRAVGSGVAAGGFVIQGTFTASADL